METMTKTTTITISDHTRRELLKIGAELQARRGQKMDYEDVIEYLISKARVNPELFKAATAPKGVASEELRKIMREGREEDRRHEEELERRYT
jgi:predicted CopG family antitoxin